MSDFLLDFRDQAARRNGAGVAVSLLKFCDDTQPRVLEREAFTLVVTRVDGFDLWGPHEEVSPQGSLLIALAGRIAMDQSQWDEAAKIPGPGGLACKAIAKLYRDGGIDALGALNGNFAVIVFDSTARKLHLVTDRCGMYLAYRHDGAAQPSVYASHPDVLAALVGESQNWDKTSFAEFLMTSRLTFPYTYYRKIRAVDPASIHSFSFESGGVRASQRRYFDFNFKINQRLSEWDLAEELATAFKNAVRRRTLPMLGRVAIGLSGGLDSRALLSVAGARDHVCAFTLFDEENAEFRVAQEIARACDVQMIPIRRDFDFYGKTAELGVRVSGGTGCITCNHYLGVREQLKQLGIQSFLTGCYCDYLLKGLALNTVESKFLRAQKLGGFELKFYDTYSRFDSSYKTEVFERLKTLFPESAKPQLSDVDWLNVERKRCFPLAYEQDLAQRVIPQRVMPWYLPIVDNEIIETYLRIPPRYKLNASVFKKMLTFVCPPEVLRIADNNTGARVNASQFSLALHRFWSSARNRISENARSQIATSGSWPNWRHYLLHSKLLESLWIRPSPVAREVLAGIVGNDPFQKSMGEYVRQDLVLLMRLLTQKLWFEARA